MSTEPLRTRIRSLLESTLERMGYELVAVEWLPSGRPLLRLSIDGPNGVGVGDAVRVNRRVSLLLDEADPIPSAYTLEVSSPGIDRPVQRATDFVRFAGKRAKLVLQEGLPRRRYSGTLQGMEADDVIIEVDGTVHRIPFEQIERAHLVLDLKEYAELSPKARQGEVPGEDTAPGDEVVEGSLDDEIGGEPEQDLSTHPPEKASKARHGARRAEHGAARDERGATGPRDGGDRPPRRGKKGPTPSES